MIRLERFTMLLVFCGTVLPLVSQNITGGSHRSHTEKLQVLQSFMSVSHRSSIPICVRI